MKAPTTGTLQDLLSMEDEIGIVTVSVGFTPSAYANGPTGPEEVRAQLRKLASDHEQRDAVQQRVDELSDRIDAMLSPHEDGRGRYLAAAVAGEEVIEHRLQVSLPPMAAFDDGPVLRHLLEAFDEHQPAGALLLHANEATLLQVGHDGHEQLREWSTRVGEIVLGDDNRGPGPSSPTARVGAVNPGGVNHRDQQRDRVRENQDRFLRELAGELRTELSDRGLARVALVGPAHERQVVRDALGTGHALRVLDVDRVASGELRETLHAIEQTLSAEHAAHEEELVITARDRAKSKGRGALGVEDVVAALNEGRVDHLLLGPTLELEGWITDEDMLVVDEDAPQAEDARPEPRLVHRMIERALSTDADVTPCDGKAAEMLDELGSVGALLRW